MRDVAIVIPVRGEGHGKLRDLIKRASRHGDVVIVDDNAIDGFTVPAYATAVGAVGGAAAVVKVPADRHGFSEAYRLGILKADEMGYRIIIEMDAGGSHDPDEIPKFISAIRCGYDVATGERLQYGSFQGHWKRRTLSRVGTWLFNLRHGSHFSDATSGFIGYCTSAIGDTHGTPFKAGMHWYQSEMRLRAMHARLNLIEVPITYKSSSSSLNWRGIAEAVWRLLVD